MREYLILVACLVVTAVPARAQQSAELTVQLDTEPGAPLSGALVALVDANEGVLAESLSGRSGQVILRAAPGQYRIRIRRIGYRPFFSDPVVIPGERRVNLHVQSPRVVLAAMIVNARAECGRINQDAATLSGAWEEIAKALKATQLTIDDISAIGRSSVYKREIGPNGSVISSDTTHNLSPKGRPFAAINPASLREEGYVRGNAALGWEYFGPDEAVLLSNGFAETHCFRVVRDERRKGELGVAFEPVPKRRTSDIKGVLWMDESTLELREITFRYVNVDMLSRFGAGGFTRFRRMPSGAWIVVEWQLRMPKLELRSSSWNNVAVIGYFENGGRVVASGAIDRDSARR